MHALLSSLLRLHYVGRSCDVHAYVDMLLAFIRDVYVTCADMKGGSTGMILYNLYCHITHLLYIVSYITQQHYCAHRLSYSRVIASEIIQN